MRSTALYLKERVHAKPVLALDMRRFSSQSNETEATFHIDIKNQNALFELEGALRKAIPEVDITFIDHNQDPTF